MNIEINKGLIRGMSYHYKKEMPEGVVFSERAKKWLVRIKRKGIIVTDKGFENKSDADNHYIKLTS